MPSETRDTRRWISDIRLHIAKAEGFVTGLSYEMFKDDGLRLYAVVRCREIISEASRRLPEELKLRHSSIERRAIEWRQMAAAGNFNRHGYEDVAARRVSITLPHDLPPLHDVVTKELAALDAA